MRWQRGTRVLWRLANNTRREHSSSERCTCTSGTIEEKNVHQIRPEHVFIDNKKQGGIKLSCQVTRKSGLKQQEEGRGNQKKGCGLPSLSKENIHTVHFIQGGRHVVVYIRTTHCVNLNTGLVCRLQQCVHALVAPNKVCRTTGQHIPSLDTSGPKASSSKPRHLCQSCHHAATAQSQVPQRGIYQNSPVTKWLTPAKATFPSSCRPLDGARTCSQLLIYH